MATEYKTRIKDASSSCIESAVSPSMSTDQLAVYSQLIGLIYDVAEDPSLWPELLLEITTLIPDVDIETSTLRRASMLEKAKPLFQLLQNHLPRAERISQALGDGRQQDSISTTMLDQLPVGVMLVNATGLVAALNTQANRIANNFRTLTLEHGRIASGNDADSRKLRCLLKEVLSADGQHEASGWQTCILAQAAHTCSIWVAILATSEHSFSSPMAMLLLASPEFCPPVSLATACSHYQLSPAESELLKVFLGESHGLSEAAIALQRSKYTVRTQMKSIMSKTGTHSQSELLKKILLGHPAQVHNKTTLNHHRHSKNRFHLTLNDGRTMSYSSFGDPDGKPLIFLHSILHSSSCFHPHSTFAEQHGIHIIAPDRPGFGASDSQVRFEPNDYGDDLLALFSHLNITQATIIGYGTGAAFALAAACALPEHIHRLGIISCVAPAGFHVERRLIPFEYMMRFLGRNTPKAIHLSYARIMMNGMKKAPDQYFNRMFRHLCLNDQAIVRTTEVRKIFIEAFNHACEYNIDGFINDYLARFEPWQFDLDSIQCPVHFWHGTDNRISHIGTARNVAGNISYANMHAFDDHGHYIFFSHWDAILQSFHCH